MTQPDFDVPDFDVIVVGAGPVGLFLGCRLAQLGLSFCVLERQTERLPQSRAIGIHPPALERLNRIGVAETMLERGVKISGGVAFAGQRKLGSLSFASCPGPYPFVLSLPQWETEDILTQGLCKLAPGALRRGLEVIGLTSLEDRVILTIKESQSASQTTLSASFIVGCDGKESTLRQLAGIAFEGRAYPDSYVMGDFRDRTDLEGQAALYFTPDGLVESFPLPDAMRRWVVKTSEYMTRPDARELAALIETRTGICISEETCSMLSSFGIQRYLAKPFVKGRLLLAGDAAHVLSPIGGQGMNLGWLDADEAADALSSVSSKPDALDRYARRRRAAALKAASRASFNTRMGRPGPFDPLRNLLAKVVTHSPLEPVFARLFTMRGL